MYLKILIDNISLVIQYFFGGIAVFYVTPLIVKSVGIHTYGNLAIMFAIVTYISVVIQYSFNLIGPKLIAEGNCKKTFNTIISAKLVLFLLSLVFFLLYFYFFQNKHDDVFLLFLVFPLSWVFNSAWYLQSKGYFVISSVCSIIGSLITFVIAYFFINTTTGLFVPILCLVLSSLINGLLTFFFAVKNNGHIEIVNPLPMLKEGMPLFVSQIISSLYTMSGVFIITYFYGVASAGTYAIVERFMNLLISLGVLTHVAAYPKLARLFNKDRLEYRKTLLFVIALYTLFSCCVAIVVFNFHQNIVTYMFGSESVNAKELIYSACIFIFVSIYGPVVTGYFTLKVKGRMIITINIIIALLSLLLGVGMLKIVGSSGWLIGLSLAQLLYFAIFFKIFIWGRKECAV
ncbi:O35 family O-antigen flippase [Escherichia coli]|jgi:PST family polysaccharide transporter|uniref:O35 family O-antigen flippase n=1 Tax=Enterobacteriaceae TaxID=543 RepID=UPI0004D3FE10|nr:MULTISPECIES: O35 family O-antigen flippase [Enterobacteriaceae]AUL69748.1 hypothetical protein BVL39_17225 [Escherichia coli]EFH1491051.1 O35 family O-antigen flippase [Escherichia coli]EHN0070224.1 O35 family O-antigen flippase [Escherichia coli]EHN0192941.1 O35 family O-antigen flippase [Escherichia coli]EHN0236536.1 O35 family O-antigen flippase [Escherichia coli]